MDKPNIYWGNFPGFETYSFAKLIVWIYLNQNTYLIPSQLNCRDTRIAPIRLEQVYDRYQLTKMLSIWPSIEILETDKLVKAGKAVTKDQRILRFPQ